jgi:hypothetical protein
MLPRVPSDPTRKEERAPIELAADDVRVPTEEAPAIEEFLVRTEDAVALEEAVEGANEGGRGDRERPAAVLRVLVTLRMDGGRKLFAFVLATLGIAGGPILPSAVGGFALAAGF